MIRPSGRPRAGGLARFLLLAPSVLLWIVFLISLGNMLWLSVSGPHGLSINFYVHFFATPVYRQVLFRTFRTAAVVTVATLVLAYPVSYLLTRVSSRTASIMMIAVVLPFFTSVMVRTYAWIVILGRQGLINELLRTTGLVSSPLSLLYNSSAVVVGMTYVMLPYMVLTLYTTMRRIDQRLLHAAQNLGASPLQIFGRVIVPLSLPGVISGSLLVFLLSLGFFITPALMGGPPDVLLAMLVEREIELTANWGFGSAMGMILFLITAGGIIAYYRVMGFERFAEGRQ
jgi:putative spermidine/putrescine transport system permease protein